MRLVLTCVKAKKSWSLHWVSDLVAGGGGEGETAAGTGRGRLDKLAGFKTGTVLRVSHFSQLAKTSGESSVPGTATPATKRSESVNEW